MSNHTSHSVWVVPSRAPNGSTPQWKFSKSNHSKWKNHRGPLATASSRERRAGETSAERVCRQKAVSTIQWYWQGRSHPAQQDLWQQTVSQLWTSIIQSGRKEGNVVLKKDQEGNTKLCNSSHMKKFIQSAHPLKPLKPTEETREMTYPLEDSRKRLLWSRQPILISTLPHLLNPQQVSFPHGLLVLDALQHGWITLCPLVPKLINNRCRSM